MIFSKVVIIIAIYTPIILPQITIKDIPLPDSSFTRKTVEKGSFGEWLRERKLKPCGSYVMDYSGKIRKKASDTTVAYVMEMDVLGRRLEQCIDILVRLYAEYSWDSMQKHNLIFPLPGGFWLEWLSWQEGFRPQFRGIKVNLIKSQLRDSSFANLETYLRTIYLKSHTQQFYYSYELIDFYEINIGDFVVKKGTKSHAILILDLAKNDSGNLYALIGHGDTPACEFHILNYQKNNVWFPISKKQNIIPLPLRRKMSWDGLRRFSLRKARS